MLQLTVKRVSDRSQFLAPLIVANSQHRELLDRQLREIDVIDATIILEPVGRNTAPAIALAALAVSPETPLLIMPSDHVIRDTQRFRDAVAEALPLTDRGYLLTFGIQADVPETGYGYIKAAEPLAPGVLAVDRFVEKPSAEIAAAYIAEGGYLWNGGIFLFQAGDYLLALEGHAPDVLAACRESIGRGSAGVPDRSAFARSPSISVDYAVMEKADRVAVVPVDIGWSDIGSWDALYDYLQTNADGGLGGNGFQIDCKNCFIQSDGPIVATIGTENLLVIATRDGVLIARRGESQKVRQVVDRFESDL